MAAQVEDGGKQLRLYVERLRSFAGKSLTVGVQGAGAMRAHPNGDGQTVGDIAVRNHFGDGHTPARPFMRIAMERNQGRIAHLMSLGAKGKVSPEKYLAILGAAVVGMAQEEISNRVPPPNAPSTIKAKGSDVPLIDTGLLRQSISFEVHEAPAGGGAKP